MHSYMIETALDGHGVRPTQSQNLLHRALHHVIEFGAGEGRHNKIKCATVHGIHIETDINQARYHDDLHGLGRPGSLLHDVRPIAIGQLGLGENQLRRICLSKQGQNFLHCRQPTDLDRITFQSQPSRF